MTNLKEKEVNFISELLTFEDNVKCKLDHYGQSCQDSEVCEAISSLSAKTTARMQTLLGCLK